MWYKGAMAAHFNISTEYIGPYFKRNVGVR